MAYLKIFPIKVTDKKRLATTDKVEYFGNLIRNGYLQGKHIDGSIFDEYIHILNTMSYREIQYLVEYKKYCEDSSKRGKSTKHINGRTYSNKYESLNTREIFPGLRKK